MDQNRRAVLKGIGAGTALAVGGVGAVSANDSPGDGTTIVDVASGVGRFSILVSALKRADLVGTLDGNRQLSVFAPNNEAFKGFLEATKYDSLSDIPEDVLTAVLKYHVTPGRRDAASVKSSDEVPTLLNGALIEVEGTELNDNQAIIIKPNLARASNGIIHEIDGVLRP